MNLEPTFTFRKSANSVTLEKRDLLQPDIVTETC